jgi:glycerate dehydrogenase
MKIVILDAKTLGNDVNLSEIRKQGELTIYNTSSAEETKERIKDAEIIITNKVVIDKAEFEVAGKLKLICVAATGYNNINVSEAKKRGITVANVKSYSTESVVQQTFAYILAIYNSIFEYQKQIKLNKWQQSDVFTMLTSPIIELNRKKIGIIGFGTIGKRVAEVAKSFGMEILIAKIPGRQYKEHMARMQLDELLSDSDIVSIHCPLSESTKNLITKKELHIMKKNAILVNMARGGIVNEQDLYEALLNEEIKGAIVDVLSTEPPKNGNILFNAPNIFITPHTAWTSVEARQRLVDGIVKNIQLFKQGKKQLIEVK